MEKEINVTVPENYDGKPIVLVIREGEAEQINEPKAYNVGMNISLPSILEYVTKKHWDSDAKNNRGLIIFSTDPTNPFINFNADPNNELAISMTAKLIDNPDFVAFNINKNSNPFSQEQLELFVKKHAHCFENVDVAKDLIHRLRNFEAKFEQTVTREDNRQGEKADTYKSAITMAKGELPKTLKLKMPLFKYQKPVEFEVEVEIDKLANNRPGFSFFTLDVELMKREQVEGLILTQVEQLKNYFPALEA